MNKHRIFVVEDDRSISGLYEIAFDKDEFEVVCFDKAEGMFDAFEKEETCDIIILDLMLPGMSGLDALKILKTNEKTKSVPVIIVSAKGDEKDKVEGLNLGADDYIAKPFGMLELIARVKASLRRANLYVKKYNEFEIDDNIYDILYNGKRLNLTLKEFKLMKILIERAGETIPRVEIFEEVWNTEYMGDTRALDMHIAQIRNKMKQAGADKMIFTVRGVGYRLD